MGYSRYMQSRPGIDPWVGSSKSATSPRPQPEVDPWVGSSKTVSPSRSQPEIDPWVGSSKSASPSRSQHQVDPWVGSSKSATFPRPQPEVDPWVGSSKAASPSISQPEIDPWVGSSKSASPSRSQLEADPWVGSSKSVSPFRSQPASPPPTAPLPPIPPRRPRHRKKKVPRSLAETLSDQLPSPSIFTVGTWRSKWGAPADIERASANPLRRDEDENFQARVDEHMEHVDILKFFVDKGKLPRPVLAAPSYEDYFGKGNMSPREISRAKAILETEQALTGEDRLSTGEALCFQVLRIWRLKRDIERLEAFQINVAEASRKLRERTWIDSYSIRRTRKWRHVPHPDDPGFYDPQNGETDERDDPTSPTSGPLSQTSSPSGQIVSHPSQTLGPLSQTSSPSNQTSSPPGQTNSPPNQINSPSNQTSSPHNQMSGSATETLEELTELLARWNSYDQMAASNDLDTASVKAPTETSSRGRPFSYDDNSEWQQGIKPQQVTSPYTVGQELSRSDSSPWAGQALAALRQVQSSPSMENNQTDKVCLMPNGKARVHEPVKKGPEEGEWLREGLPQEVIRPREFAPQDAERYPKYRNMV